MAALNRAVALAEVNDIAMLVGENLKFDVMGPLDVFLEKHFAIAECGKGLTPGRFHMREQFFTAADDPEASPPATHRGFDHDRVADSLCKGDRLGGILYAAIRSGNDRHAGLSSNFTGVHLVPHEANGLRGGSNESDS